MLTREPSRETEFDRSITNSAEYFGALRKVLERISFGTIDRITSEIWGAYQQDKSIFIFGNGGSAALASHACCDLGKGTFVGGKKRWKVISLTDNVPLLTAWANDSCYEEVFSQQLANFIQPGDVALAISGSGNSANVINGLQYAIHAGARTIGITGFDGGKMRNLCDTVLIVPSDNMQLIEDAHLSVCHAIFTSVRQKMHRALAVGASQD